MAYINNGTSRSLKVLITKYVGGIQVQGYPKTYDGQLAFPGYSALTDLQARQLSDSQYNTRLAAFKAYVQSAEPGSSFVTDVTGTGPIITNDPNCLPTTTTTTTVPPTTLPPTTTSTTTVAPDLLFVGYIDHDSYPYPDVDDTNKDIPDVGISHMRLWLSTASTYGTSGSALVSSKPFSFSITPVEESGYKLEMQIINSYNINGVILDSSYLEVHGRYIGGLSVPSGVKAAYIDFMLKSDNPVGNGLEYYFNVFSPQNSFRDTIPTKGTNDFGWSSVAQNVLLGSFAIRQS